MWWQSWSEITRTACARPPQSPPMRVAARSRSKVAHTPVVCEFPRASDQHRDAKPIKKLPATNDATNIPSRPLHWAITCPAVFAAAAVTATRQAPAQQIFRQSSDILSAPTEAGDRQSPLDPLPAFYRRLCARRIDQQRRRKAAGCFSAPFLF